MALGVPWIAACRPRPIRRNKPIAATPVSPPRQDWVARRHKGQQGSSGGDGDVEGDSESEGVVGTQVQVRDAFILDEATVGVSDHCPVGIDLDVCT